MSAAMGGFVFGFFVGSTFGGLLAAVLTYDHEHRD